MPTKAFFTLLLAALLGLACNFTVTADPGPTATPTLDLNVISTQVAQTVEAAQIQPSATVEPPPAATDPAATETPTNTPEPSPTPQPSPTATLTTDDPRALLGDPDWRDAFNTEGNWTLFNTADIQTEIKNGYFHYTMKKVQAPSSWTISWPTIQDFYLEATAITPDACARKDRYGLMFRAPDPNHGFIYSFSCDGQFRLAKWDGTNFDILKDWTPSDAILAGPNQTNRIGVHAVGNKIRLYANGVFLAEVSDGEFNAANKFGFNLGSDQTANFTVRFDEIAYWEIE